MPQESGPHDDDDASAEFAEDLEYLRRKRPSSRPFERNLEMDFAAASFPSDVISVARLRKLFPERFDPSDSIVEGYTRSDFFYPHAESTRHLVRLSELISDERVVAAGAYYRRFVDRYPEVFDSADAERVAAAKRELEENYQFFHVADSPETARFLIRQVEEVGDQQALTDRSRGR